MTIARADLAALLCLVFGACSREEKPVEPPGLRNANGELVVSQPLVKPTPARPVQPPDFPSDAVPNAERGVYPVDERRIADPLAPPGSSPGLASAPDAAAEQPPRDLTKELAQLLDPRGACLDYAAIAAKTGQITLRAEASVLPSGRIMRATVTAPGQSSEARSCLEARLLAAQLDSPVPSAPRTVAASLTVEVAAGKPATATPGPERARSPDSPNAPELAKPDQADLARPDPGDVAGAP